MVADPPRLPNNATPDLTVDLGAGLTKKMEYSGGQIIYLGQAQPGTLSSELGWQIQKFTYSGSDLTDVQFANGSRGFNFEYDERASYTYA